MDSEGSGNDINSNFTAPENNGIVNSLPMNSNQDAFENAGSITQSTEENISATPLLDVKEYNDPDHFYHRPNSLRLESVLEYTSKIKAFLGLEEESLISEVNGESKEDSNTNTSVESTLDKSSLVEENEPNNPETANERPSISPTTICDADTDNSLKIIEQLPDNFEKSHEGNGHNLKTTNLPDILDTHPDFPEVVSVLSPDIIPESENPILIKTNDKEDRHSDLSSGNSDSDQNYFPDIILNEELCSNILQNDSDVSSAKNALPDLENIHAEKTELDENKKEDTAGESDELAPLTVNECQKVKDEKKYGLEQLESGDEHSEGEETNFNNEQKDNSSELYSLKEKVGTETESVIGDAISRDEEDSKATKMDRYSGKFDDLVTIKDSEMEVGLTKEKPYQIMDIVEGLNTIEKSSNPINNNAIIGIPDQGLQGENKEDIIYRVKSGKSDSDNTVPNIEDLRRISREVVNSVLQSAGDQIKVILDEENLNEPSKESRDCIPREVESISLQGADDEQGTSNDNSDSKLVGVVTDVKDNICLPQDIIPDFPTLNTQTPYKNEDRSEGTSSENTKQKKIEMKNLSASVESIVVCTIESSCETDPNTQCGIGAFKPKCIQKYATARTYLVLYSILGILHGSYYTYLVGVLSTLEKRFEFKSKTSGFIMMLDELTPLFLGVLVGHFGGRAHRPRLLSFGMFLSAFCCFASALPYFLYGTAIHLSSTGVHNVTGPEVCDGEARMDYCDSDDRPPTMTAITLLMLGSFLKGFGNLAYYAIGLAYLDDNAKKKNSPLYFAVAFALRLLGPMVGYLMSSAFLKYYESPFDDPGFGPDDPRWIGGWWMGFMLQGVLLLIFAGPIALFPRRLPGHMSAIQEMEQNSKPFFEGLGDALKRLARNPLFILITLNAILTIYGNFGYYIMVPKYMENQFHFSASTASLFAGPPGIAAIMLSTILGGYLMWRFKPSAKFLAAGLVTVEIISTTGYLLLMIPQCQTTELASFGFGEESLILENSCNMNCNCSTVSFNPICGPDGITTYFSPCYAGCSYQKNQSYFNCSCTRDYSEDAIATKGFCSVNCWSSAITYIIMLPVFQFTCNTVRVAFTIILLRSMKPEDKNIALGVFETLISTLAFIPFPILYGALVDSACLVWEKSCGESGNCWFYDMKTFNYLLHGSSAAFCGMAVICLSSIFCFIDRIQDLYEDFDEKPQHIESSGVERNKEDSVVIKI